MQSLVDRLSRAQLVWGGLLLGFTWGVLIRLWMRLISTDPEFTWGGTLYIVIASALVGLGVGGAAAGQRSTRRWVRRTTRGLGGAALILLGAAAGILLLAAVVPLTLGLFERRWWKAVRVVLVLLGVATSLSLVSTLVDDLGAPKAAFATLLLVGLGGVLCVGWGSVVGSTPRSRTARVEPERGADRGRRVVDSGLEIVG